MLCFTESRCLFGGGEGVPVQIPAFIRHTAPVGSISPSVTMETSPLGIVSSHSA